MQISFSTLGPSLARGDMVQTEVVATHEHGSMVMVNGVPVSTDKALPLGQRLTGKVDQVEGNQATVTLLPETGNDAQLTIPDKWLAANQFPIDAENQAIFEMFRRLNIPVSLEMFQKAKDLFQALNPGMDKSNLDALGFLLLRSLPKSAFPMVKEYLEGKLKFGALFENLSNAEKTQFFKEWAAGKLLDQLTSLIDPERLKDMQKAFSKTLPEELSRNLTFQEALSVMPRDTQEGRMYFQWPMFWHGQTVPDTLEGEAFFSKPGKEGQDGGFSLRVLVNPPRLGPLELNIHRMQSNLWIHFGTEKKTDSSPLKDIFQDISDGLQKLGWKSVRLTLGNRSNRPTFLSPPESDRPLPMLKKLDVRV